MCMRCHSLEVLMRIVSMIVMNHSKMYVVNVDGNKYNIVSLISLHVQTVALIYIIIIYIYIYVQIFERTIIAMTHIYTNSECIIHILPV